MKLKIVFQNQTYNSKFDFESCEHLGRKTRKILTNRHTSRLVVDIRTQRGTHQIKYKILYSAVTEIKKYIK